MFKPKGPGGKDVNIFPSVINVNGYTFKGSSSAFLPPFSRGPADKGMNLPL